MAYTKANQNFEEPVAIVLQELFSRMVLIKYILCIDSRKRKITNNGVYLSDRETVVLEPLFPKAKWRSDGKRQLRHNAQINAGIQLCSYDHYIMWMLISLASKSLSRDIQYCF